MVILGPFGPSGYNPPEICGDTDLWQGERLRYLAFVGSLLVHTLLQSVIRGLGTGFKLTDKSREVWRDEAGFIRELSCSIISGVYMTILGPAGIYYATVAALGTSSADGVILHDGSSGLTCRVAEVATALGSFFGGNAMFQCFSLLMGWEKGGIAMWIHHISFTVLGFACPYGYIFYELTLFALAMETSTPVLQLMLMLRAVQGNEAIVGSLGSIFALLFFLTRILFFGFGIFRSLMFWTGAGPTVGDRLSLAVVVQAFFCGGYVLQLVWFRVIAARAINHICGVKSKKIAQKQS